MKRSSLKRGMITDNPEKTAIGVPDPCAQNSLTAALVIWVLIGFLLALFNYLAVAQLNVPDQRMRTFVLAKEHGPLEWTQAITLTVAIALCCSIWLRGVGALRVAGALVALTAAIVLVREVDLDKLKDGGVWVDWAVTYKLPKVMLVSLGVVFVSHFFVQRRYFWAILALGRTWRVVPFLVAIGLVASGQFYVENLPLSTGVENWDQYETEYWDRSFLEEILETNGYMVFTVAVWQYGQLVGNPDFDASV